MSDEVVVRVADAEVIRGQDGFSPIFSEEAVPGGHLITVEDANGLHEFTILDGERGKTGPTGAKGEKGDPGNYTKPVTGIPKSDFSSPVQSALVRKNLLNNWYFVGGGSQQGSGKLPINQRRQTIWQNVGYTIDRWKLISGTAYLSEAGLVLTGTLVQIRETPIGLPVTCSALLSDGTLITPTYDDTSKTFTLTATGQTIKAVKLELGAEQTLAHQENGVWVLNELPNFNDELTACKRYYQRFQNNGIYVGMERDTVTVTENENDTVYGTLWFNIPVPVQMRSSPTITAIPDTPAEENGPLVDWNYYICTSSSLFTAKNATITGVYNLGNTMIISLRHSASTIPAYTSVNVLIPVLEADAEL